MLCARAPSTRSPADHEIENPIFLAPPLHETGDAGADPPAEMLPFLTGDAQPPLPTYFVGAYGEQSD